MNNRSSRLKNHLRNSDDDPLENYLNKAEEEISSTKHPRQPGRFRSVFALVLVVVMGFFLLRGFSSSSVSPAAIFTGITNVAGPSEDLLTRMGNRMEEMGYTGLTHDDLRALRSDGVTATYISNVRALGYTDLTLDESVSLANANASSAFIAMMIELGYTLDTEEIVRLRNAGVTAHYTSNIHDLGYRDVTPDQLIRMQRIGVTPGLIRELQGERGEEITLEEIIRYRISNQ